MASTPSKIPGPSKGRPARESKLTPVSRVPHRDVSGKRRSELASPKAEAVRKTRTPPSSAASSQSPGSSLRQPATSSSPSLDTKAKSVNMQDDYAVSTYMELLNSWPWYACMHMMHKFFYVYLGYEYLPWLVCTLSILGVKERECIIKEGTARTQVWWLYYTIDAIYLIWC